MELYIVGIGPGSAGGMTGDAYDALEKSELIVGYSLYIDQIKDLFKGKKYYTTGMRGETDRVAYALAQAAAGVKTAVVCSGDAEVYGMAPLIFEMAGARGMDTRNIQVVPGVTAALSCGALLGSPLSCDFAVISLSDLLVSWDQIERRLSGAAAADLPVVLYNPGSRRRTGALGRACEIMLEHKAPDTVCGAVRNAGRGDGSVEVMTLSELADYRADMLTTVFIGSRSTYTRDGRIVTPRGYSAKYNLAEGGPAAGKDRAREGHSTVSGHSGRLLIFGGTVEGRKLAEAARDAGYGVTLSVVSEYGRETAEQDGEGIEIISGKLPEDSIEKLLRSGRYSMIIDATHPYAEHISSSILQASRAAGVQRVRLARPTAEDTAGALTFSTMGEIIEYLNERSGRVFFSTGSGAAEEYAELSRAADRAVIRILPSETALAKVRGAGFTGKNIICMQGPFTEEMNEACFRFAGAEYLVTKSSGKEGGFDAKISAARKLGMKILILLPPEENGPDICSFEDIMKIIEASGDDTGKDRKDWERS